MAAPTTSATTPRAAKVEALLACSGCGKRTKTARSSVLCGDCVESRARANCAGCGLVAPPAGAADRVDAFRRPWHAACAAKFHPGAAVAAGGGGAGTAAAGGGGRGGGDRSTAATRGGSSGMDNWASEAVPLGASGGGGGAASGGSSSGGGGGDAPPAAAAAAATAADAAPAAARRDPTTSANPSATFLFYSSPVPRSPIADAAAGGTSDGAVAARAAAIAAEGAARAAARGSRRTSGARRPSGVRLREAGFFSPNMDVLIQRIKAMGIVKERRERFKTVTNCVVARELVDYLVNSGQCATRSDAVATGRKLVQDGLFVPVSSDGGFDDDGELHRLVDARVPDEAPGVRMELLRGGGGGGGGGGPAGGGGGDTSSGAGGGEESSAGSGGRLRRDEAGRAARVAVLTGTLFKDGYLTKQGHKVRNWKKRWFVLKGKYLSYYKKREDTTKQAGRLAITDYRLERASSDKSFTFRFAPAVAGLDEYLVRAGDAVEYDEWVAAIEGAMRDWAEAGERPDTRARHDTASADDD